MGRLLASLWLLSVAVALVGGALPAIIPPKIEMKIPFGGPGPDESLSKIQVSLSERSNLRGRSRSIAVVTTATLPWMTGTAVNPLLRAVYLERRKEKHSVTLCVPWIEPEEQHHIFAKGQVFRKREELEQHIRDWVKAKLGFVTKIKIRWWDGVYLPSFGSIFPTGDVVLSIPVEERDVAVLEEPEHLTWYHQGVKWCEAFNWVVGIIHTNYWSYAINDHQSSLPLRVSRAYILRNLNVWCARSYCHRIIKLSDAVQEFPNSVTLNIHGVRNKFIDIGASRASRNWFGSPRFSKGAYFIGKALWAKGYTQLLNLLRYYREVTGVNLPLDIYGHGPDEDQIKAKVEDEGLAWSFMGAIDHAHQTTHDYKVMINPSLSDVVCTTSAEALAMGKIVVCADHPSNEFFRTFPNCLVYKTPREFCQQLAHAMSTDPVPLSEDDRYRLSWEAATERFYDASYTSTQRIRQTRVNRVLARLHNHMATWPILRASGPDSRPAKGGEPVEAASAPMPDVIPLRTMFMIALTAAIFKGPEIVEAFFNAYDRHLGLLQENQANQRPVKRFGSWALKRKGGKSEKPQR